MKAFPLIALLACAGCSGGASDEAAPVPTALVSLAPARPGVLVERVTLYGVAESGAAGKAVLSAPAEATVERIVAPVGTRIAAGDVVVALRATPNTRLDIAKASADARAADAAFARAQRLRADGLVSDADVETTRAAAASADLTRASLTGRAGALTLRAPAAGFVETVPVNPGDIVQAGAAVATIARGGDLRARFGADPSTARRLSAGATLTIAPGGGGAPFAVPVESVAPVVDPATRLAAIFVRLPAQRGIGAGETLTASAAIGARAGSGSGLTIPYAALLDDGGQPYVFVVSGNVAHRHDVVVGASEGDRIPIAKGLRAGDLVVTAGGTAVEDGMRVRTR